MLINEYFIECFDKLSSHLLDMFNMILDAGHLKQESSIAPLLT